MFEGSMVAIVTPSKNGKIDYPRLKKLIDFHIEEGTDVIVPCGTTGEAATMSLKEHSDVLSFTVDHVGGRVPVICGAGSNNTEEALLLVKHAKKIKADGVLVVTPYYNKPSQEGLYRHFEFLAKKVNIPFVLYNVPSRTGISITPDTVVRLSKISNIVGIKEASGSLDQAAEIIARTNLDVISGEDGLTFPLMAIGAKGAISVVANVAPKLNAQMIRHCLEGDYEAGRKIHYQLLELINTLFIETNPIPTKTALGMMGMLNEEFRLPLCSMSKEKKATLKKVLNKYGLIKHGKRTANSGLRKTKA